MLLGRFAGNQSERVIVRVLYTGMIYAARYSAIVPPLLLFALPRSLVRRLIVSYLFQLLIRGERSVQPVVLEWITAFLDPVLGEWYIGLQ